MVLLAALVPVLAGFGRERAGSVAPAVLELEAGVLGLGDVDVGGEEGADAVEDLGDALGERGERVDDRGGRVEDDAGELVERGAEGLGVLLDRRDDVDAADAGGRDVELADPCAELDLVDGDGGVGEKAADRALDLEVLEELVDGEDEVIG
jgi:hypothetical protein